MKPLSLDDLPELSCYDALRPALRDAVIAHKKERRVGVGDRVSLVFEDRETLRWQVLEMARVEHIRDPRALQLELDVYNELLPGESELSATLFIEITDLAEIRPALDRMVGIDEHVALVLGEGDERETIRARFDEKQLDEDRVSAVQYVRFPLSPADARLLAETACPASIAIDHPAYMAEVPLPVATRASLLRDLSGGGPSLLDPGLTHPASRPDAEPIAGSERVLAFRRSPDRIDLEPLVPVEDLAHVEPALLAEITRLGARLAGKLRAANGEEWELVLDLETRPVHWRLAPRRS